MIGKAAGALLEITLLADGSSDRALVPIVETVFDTYCADWRFVVRFAEGLHMGALTPRLMNALEHFPCDILLIHRDAERENVSARESEINAAILATERAIRSIRIVPVRMTESWLLLDESAIRSASGNPNGTAALNLPRGLRAEFGDAKATLFQAIKDASELPARRLPSLDLNVARQRVASLLDVSALDALPSFMHFKNQVKHIFAATA